MERGRLLRVLAPLVLSVGVDVVFVACEGTQENVLGAGAGAFPFFILRLAWFETSLACVSSCPNAVTLALTAVP